MPESVSGLLITSHLLSSSADSDLELFQKEVPEGERTLQHF